MDKLSVNQLLLPSAACNADLLPTVTNAYWPYYSDTELVPGTTATIECYLGYHFPGTPVAMNTPEPTLPTTTAPPTPLLCESLKMIFFTFNSVSQYVPPNGGNGKAVNAPASNKLGDINESNKDDCCWACQTFVSKFTNFGHQVNI